MKIAIDNVSHYKYNKILNYIDGNGSQVCTRVNGTLVDAHNKGSARYALEISFDENGAFRDPAFKKTSLGLLRKLLEPN